MSAITIVAALTVSGCGAAAPTPATPTTVGSPTPPSPSSPPPAGPLPAPQAVTAVLDRLADPAVPAEQKLTLIEDGAAPDAGTIDRFATALRGGGFAPAVVTATDVAYAPTRPGEVVATVTIAKDKPDERDSFVFPLVFREGPDGWQLTRQTAEMLLAFPTGR